MVLSVVGGCTGFKDRETIQALLTEARPRMEADRSALGAVSIHDNVIDLLEGQLRLAVRVPHEDQKGRPVHFHVVATPTNRGAAALELCIVGVDHADAARSLIDHALPPLVSAIRRQPVLDATHTWSDTPHGIAGHSAYIGRYYVRSESHNPAFANLIAGGLFEDAPPLPTDGHMHVVKVTAAARDGGVFRTIELDGTSAVEVERRLAEPSSAPGMLVVFAVLDGQADPIDDADPRAEAHRLLAARPAWLPDAQVCPAGLAPASFTSGAWDPAAARGGRLLDAVRGCERGIATLCYSAAQSLISEDLKSRAAQALFLRSCQLGSESACTNAAAGRPQDDCAFETYEASCERGQDPWGCAMLGHALASGDPKHRDLVRARAVLPLACKFGDGDPACEAARRLLDELGGPDAPASPPP